MKRIKIMLLSLLVLAVVGGTLAFKANSRFIADACTAQPLINGACPAVCPNFRPLVTTSADASQGAILRCTGLPIISTNGQPTCVLTNGQFVQCVAPTFITPNF